MCLNNKDSETYRGNRGISSLKRMKFSIKMLQTMPKELKLFANFDVKRVKMAKPSQKWDGDLILWNFKFKIKLRFAVNAIIIAKSVILASIMKLMWSYNNDKYFVILSVIHRHITIFSQMAIIINHYQVHDLDSLRKITWN